MEKQIVKLQKVELIKSRNPEIKIRLRNIHDYGDSK